MTVMPPAPPGYEPPAVHHSGYRDLSPTPTNGSRHPANLARIGGNVVRAERLRLSRWERVVLRVACVLAPRLAALPRWVEAYGRDLRHYGGPEVAAELMRWDATYPPAHQKDDRP